MLQKKSKPKSRVQVKVKKVIPKAQAKTKTRKVMLKTKANVAPAKAKKVVPKAKKAQVKTKKIASKSKAAPNKNIKEVFISTFTETVLDSDVQLNNIENNEDYMNKEQLDHFRATLLQWKERLIEEANNRLHEDSNHPDPIDRASKEEELGLELSARERKRKLLKKIEEALARLNNNSYGYCDNCGAKIGIGRLEVHPTATQCVDCRTVTEAKEKQVGEAESPLTR